MPALPRIDSVLRKCRSWDEFRALVDLTEPTKAKGDLFERLTQLYLLTHPEYRTTLKTVWRLEEVPPRLRNKLHLPGPDEGIDLIAETRRGEYWAVQCKYRRAKDRALGYAELATFSSLAFVTCRHVSLGIVAHTAAKPIRKRKLLGNTVEIGLERWLDLRPEDWAAILQELGDTEDPLFGERTENRFEALRIELLG